MKTRFLAVIVVMMALGAGSLFAQNSAALSLYDKYGGKEGYTTVSISKDLFAMFAEMETTDTNMQEVKAMMNQLDGIKVLMYETEDPANAELAKFKGEVSKIQTQGYTELMVVKQSNEEVKFLTMKKGDKIGELLLIIVGEKEAGFVSITGNIDMKTIGQLSKTMNFEGMEKLNELNKEEK
jgi:hypothetical protein